MATKYYAVLTNVGAAKLANATALGAQVEITQMAVGDGNGVLPTPNPAQTALVHELRRKPLNSLSIDPNNANQIIAEQVIPEDEGGWWIREIGLFDKDGDMIAVANCAETYKPQLQEGSGRVQVVRMILIVSSTAAVTLKIDPSVVLATRQYVDDQIIQVKSYVDQKMAAHVAAADPHKQYAPKESPALTGRPTAPTAEGKDSSTQIANTAFVQAAIAALVGSSPEALDTLNELAAALGNDPNFATTVTNSLAGKMDKSANGSDIENVSVFLQNLGLGETINLAKNAVPATRRVNSKPLTGDITLWTSDVGAISADAVGEITDNGTMASANTPGWWRVAVSNSDTVTDFPTYPDGSKLYSYGYLFVEKIGEVWFQHYYAHMGANAKRQDWGTVPNTSRPWIIDYNTANKPTAGDVGALPITGGRVNGPLGIGTDNALGGNSIAIGDNDTGIKQNGDGVLDIYANSAHVLRFISGLVECMTNLKVNGNAVATGEVQAGNGSSRMTNNGDIFGSVWNGWLSIYLNNNLVADVQLGAGTSVSTWNNAGSWPNTPGYVVTSVWKDAQGENIDGIAYAPLQKRVGNQWYTVQGGTA
ncbi:phage tail protein [Salmonella enterica subsp. enterica serovar Oslo]|nr:phage tail protein [Salmonella enterica]EBB8078621.1 phage tail protein [Salmonella enterica subsp. enterica serovar Oslo]EBB9035052.1 phage tail protein [Salmonella enterica subsp. enterica serovar Oslo]EBC4522509.1 phage tail protein [Salmonella enterica]EBG9996632.1 phage tail protein [Salmonella enterica]